MLFFNYKSSKTDVGIENIDNDFTVEESRDMDTKKPLLGKDGVDENDSLEKEECVQLEEKEKSVNISNPLTEDKNIERNHQFQNHLKYVNQVQKDLSLFNRDFEKSLNARNPDSRHRTHSYNFMTQYLIPLHTTLRHHSDSEILDDNVTKNFF
uniref:Uncharacterized protein n=1 Tax=Parastrongyloides trichosuri TaxID=131310 RepID=A0A0N4ZHA2_PARTI